MSVQITFEPDGDGGLVAEGASLWEAAKRLGVKLRAECKGRGDCDSCAVVIERGAELLSGVTSAEQKLLGLDRLRHLHHPERLACQAILAAPGDLVLRLAPASEEEQKSERANTFRGLPFKEKVGALIELEAVTITEALNSLRGSYQTFVGKLLKVSTRTTKDTGRTTKDGQQTTKETPSADDTVE